MITVRLHSGFGPAEAPEVEKETKPSPENGETGERVACFRARRV